MGQTHTGETERHGTGLLDTAIVVAENIRLLILLPLGAGLLALGIGFVISPTFTATTRLLPPQQHQGLAATLTAQLGALTGGAATFPGVKNPADIYVAMLKSRTIADRLIERFKLKELYEKDLTDEARQVLENRVRIIATRDGLISVSVDDHDPKRAADIANAYVDALFTLTQTLTVTEAGQRRLFFEQQVKKAKDDLTRAEVALRSAGINEATLNTVPQSALEFLANLKIRITAQEVRVASLRGSMTGSNPEVKQAETELAALRAQLTKIEGNHGSKIGERGADYIARFRDFKYHETLFELVAKQYEVARLDEAREAASIQVVDVAVAPELKSKPKKALIAVATTFGAFFVTLVIVLVRQVFRNAAHDPASAPKINRLREVLGLRRH